MNKYISGKIFLHIKAYLEILNQDKYKIRIYINKILLNIFFNNDPVGIP